MKAIGLVGLGNLGRAVATRLLAQSVPLLVWNRTTAKYAGLMAPAARSALDLAREVDVVILNLFDSAAVEEVLTGPKGILHADMQGKTIIDTTTNHHRQVTRFHSLVEEKGGSYLEAPVLGSVAPALQGTLTMLVSGREEAYKGSLPLLQLLASAIFYLGVPGRATGMKLINNMVLGTVMAVIAEAVALGEKAGIQKETVIGILAAGAGNSGVLNAKREKLLKHDFTPNFSCGAIAKDLRYLGDFAADIGITTMSGVMAGHVFERAIEKGLRDADFSAVYDLFAEG